MAQPELNNDAITEILLRFPPADPACLIRAALVCKPLRRILTGSAFLRRYREFHRTPPLLGFLYRGWHNELNVSVPCFVPTTAAPPFPKLPPECRDSSLVDCRHRRVLFQAFNGDNFLGLDFLVWDPITGSREKVHKPPIPCLSYSAAVLCGIAGCDHRNCHGTPFRVLILGLHYTGGPVYACLYSSETRAWGTPAVPLHHADIDSWFDFSCGALVKDELYYCVWGNKIVIEYDLGENRLSLIDLPNTNRYGSCSSVPMLMEDGSLGYACTRDSSLCLWSRKVMKPDGVVVGWVQRKAVELELEKLVPALKNKSWYSFRKKKKLVPELISAAQGVDVVFMATSVGIFMYDFKSGEARKVGENFPTQCRDLLPFMSFYTPDYVINEKRRPWQERHIIDQDEVVAEHFSSLSC
ncbi:hypothetical protein QOZ80_7BG0585090 [Eleusine coracana subsp. coracana]|nr:hypothetical protein QOZ80_7BG0585090 [Eleusine coracana subsp. coracana]